MNNLTKTSVTETDSSVAKTEPAPLRIPSTAEVLQKLQTSDFVAVEEAIASFLMDVFKKNNAIKINVTPNMLMGGVSDSQAQQMRYGYINEWASLIVSLFSNNKYRPRKEFLESLLYYKHSFEWLFTASVWNNTDSLIERLGLLKPNRRGQLKLNDSQLLILLSLICLNSSYKLPWVDFIKAQPGITTTAYIALLNQSFPAISKTSSEGFNYLLEIAKDFPMLEFEEPRQIEKFLGSFFHCSYATSKHKYEFKKWLTKLIRFNFEKQWLTDEVKNKVKSVPSELILKKNIKPKMLVMIEKLQTGHAMYRSFRLLLSTLVNDYQLIAITKKDDIDESSMTLFDDVSFIESDLDLNTNVDFITSHYADVIFYPSIGMSLWTICLSQLRLAPKQIMMGGHPSSSFSSEIDCFLIPGNTSTCHELQPYFDEKIVMANLPTDQMIFHTKHDALTDDFVNEFSTFIENDDVINVAINGVITKVTDELISICQKIEQQTDKKINFIFFSMYRANTIANLSILKQISKELKYFELLAYKDYLQYMQDLSRAHFLLPTLPFTGSNSNADAIILNKPKLFLRGNSHLYTRTDSWIWDKVGMMETFGCYSKEELITRSVELVNNKEKRKHYSTLMLENKCREALFECDKNLYTKSITTLFTLAIES
jgi:hypothetical protein